MIEEVEMKNIRMKTRQFIVQSVRTSQRTTIAVVRKTIYRRQYWYMVVGYIVNCTQSNANPVRRSLGSVLVEIQPVIPHEFIIWKNIISMFIIIFIKNFQVQYLLFNFSEKGFGV
jgi:hypothetical protein